MFPNVRLLIMAVLASVVVLSCGFGVFAALRVNHEPLTRLPAESAALQLVASNPGPPAATLASGHAFGSAAQSIEAEIAGATARLKALDLDHRHDANPAEPVSAISPDLAPVAENAADPPVTPSAMVTAQPTPDPLTAQPTPQPPIADLAPQPITAAAASNSAPSPQGAVSPASDSAQTPAEPTAAAPAPTQQFPNPEPEQGASDRVLDTTGAASAVASVEPAAIVQPADRDQAVAHTARGKHLATKRTKAPRRKIIRKVVAPRMARRMIRTRRVAPAFAQPNTQSFAYSQPTLQAAPQSFQQAAPPSFQQAAPQPIQRTTRLRPRRMIKKAAVRRAPAKKTAFASPVVKPLAR